MMSIPSVCFDIRTHAASCPFLPFPLSLSLHPSLILLPFHESAFALFLISLPCASDYHHHLPPSPSSPTLQVGGPRHPGQTCGPYLRRHAALAIRGGQLYVRCPVEHCGRSLQTLELREVGSKNDSKRLLLATTMLERLLFPFPLFFILFFKISCILLYDSISSLRRSRYKALHNSNLALSIILASS
jgi:hypothetical protein